MAPIATPAGESYHPDPLVCLRRCHAQLANPQPELNVPHLAGPEPGFKTAVGSRCIS
jgi:hypothetical protein